MLKQIPFFFKILHVIRLEIRRLLRYSLHKLKWELLYPSNFKASAIRLTISRATSTIYFAIYFSCRKSELSNLLKFVGDRMNSLVKQATLDTQIHKHSFPFTLIKYRIKDKECQYAYIYFFRSSFFFSHGRFIQCCRI